jgi:hypothetical protein
LPADVGVPDETCTDKASHARRTAPTVVDVDNRAEVRPPYDSWQETVYLLRSPENARRLMEAVARDRAEQSTVPKTIDDLREMAGGEE